LTAAKQSLDGKLLVNFMIEHHQQCRYLRLAAHSWSLDVANGALVKLGIA